jgi:16S rRNA processing protein RimM
MSQAMIRVGRINGPFGLEGAVKVLPLTDFEDRFDPGSALYLDGVARKVQWRNRRSPGLVVKLDGLDSRTLAEMHRGRYLEVPAADARELPEGSFYHHQLVGVEVVTASGTALGELVEVLERPANDVWVVRDVSGSVERLVPATRDAVIEVDTVRRRVVVADWILQVEEA